MTGSSSASEFGSLFNTDWQLPTTCLVFLEEPDWDSKLLRCAGLRPCAEALTTCRKKSAT